jgi:phage replication-related protein YjqB (UPF0714/DUF867 family)
MIGGIADDSLKQDVKAELENQLPNKYKVWIAGSGESDNGDDPENIMNRIADSEKQTIQLEQSYEVRDKEWENVAQALINVFDPLL